MQLYKSDVIVVGSGVAGLSFAIHLAMLKPNCIIHVLSKSVLDDSNTNYAQGGIAGVMDSKDSFEAHIEDTLKSGKGLSVPSIVRLVVESAPERIKELADFGVDFTYQPNGDFDLALEGGHSAPRVVHAFDHTGYYVQQTLIKTAKTYSNISFFENRHSFELIPSNDNEIIGLTALNTDTNEIERFQGKITVLATGGSGQVYKNTTNPEVATGDGLVMGMKVGAKTSNLNFVQFHPSALFEKQKTRLDLLTEAIRGFGAYIINKEGHRFVFKYDERGELATRDIVSNAIFSELKESSEECVYLDCRHIEYTAFKTKFPQITENLESKGFNIQNDVIPIVPAAHYQCGGLTVDEESKTNISRLYAIGECSDTGLHGANRLASNSLLEGLVFGNESAQSIAFLLDEITFIDAKDLPNYTINTSDDDFYRKKINLIKTIMLENATISADLSHLETAKKELHSIQEEIALRNNKDEVSSQKITANNLIDLALKIVQQKIEYFNFNHLSENQIIKELKR